MLHNPLNSLRKRSARKQNQHETVSKAIFLVSPRKYCLKKSQFQILIYDLKSNIYMSYDAFNKLRKESKAKYSLESACQWLYCNWCCRGISRAICYLPSPSLQISSGGSADWIPRTYYRTNYTDDNQNSQGCLPETSGLCARQQSNDWGGHKSCHISLSCQRRLSWLIAPDKIMRFVWNTFLIVTWKKNSSKATILLFQIGDAL